MEAKHAEAIVEVMSDSVNQLVTVEHFDAGLAKLHTRIDGQSSRIDSVQTQLQAQIDALRVEMRAEIVRSHLLLVSILIAANALMLTVLGILLNQGAIV